MSDPRHASEYARRLLVEELVRLCGADKLNLVQWRKQLDGMSLDDLEKTREQVFEELDERFSIVCTN